MEHITTYSIFLQLMRVALGNANGIGIDDILTNALKLSLSAKDWEEVMSISAKQGVTGIAFSGLEKLPKSQMPPLEVIMDWSAIVDYAERENRLLNSVNVKVCDMFQRDGKRACIVKGTSIGIYYPEPLRRNPGDVDVWMAGGYKAVYEYLSDKFSSIEGKRYGHHLSVNFEGISLEVHFIPAEIYNFWHNRYLRNYYKKIESMPWNNRISLDDGDIVVPESQVSLVIVIVHLFHHWAFEGIGMKQVLDCYWLLKHVNTIGVECHKIGDTHDCCKTAEEMKREVMVVLSSIGIKNFVAALMYVLHQLGMDKSQMLCTPNTKYGKRLFDDILATGIVSADELATGKYGSENKVHKFFRRLQRVVRMMPIAPSEMPWVLLKNIWGWMLGRTK